MSDVESGAVLTLAIPLAFLIVVVAWLGFVARRRS
jgi:hypothetical protein